MTIYVLIPVFNRVQHTRRVIDALRQQSLAPELNIVVINDGSTDDTATYLSQQKDVVELRGNGSLWWGGAIQKGLAYALARQRPNDYVLFLNNDTWFEPDYVETLMRVSKEGGGAAVGSVIHEDDKDPPIVSIGPRINLNRIAVWDLFNELSPDQIRSPAPTYKVDALSGRGTLYPIELFELYGQMRPFWLPHYLADYEIAMRFGRAGVPLLVSSHAAVYSPPVYGNDVSSMNWWDRLFSPRSSSNIIRRLAFYMLVGSPLQRLTAPLRMTCFAALRALQQFKINQKESSPK
ncbi:MULTISPECIES: glycosyltransferase family 2 protein [unclassified Herbaspirillum]|uniref:glycosyltransferase family 2 protein n=1 Tax=unclassified Herbaspirillum TaxID=2624150 RepID=UPI000E2E8DA7|nr:MULTISPECIES: glycosyltransferase family 2 protein [unclassified Herbaspirillum]RFB67135.1 glycosyltransferase family 2 protein [Herbaspirillum sp. 3R-3a1]TFI06175.1 glycosyltransferase family 2 protein [Herbaspirillum sp. 3R11]TFI14212.1 glycosyltransferase family 2 protein [Herbaspirillum sp. 3R-11]TFI28859.1 glycosyltransferase family 2 protein [Herbaspirillum sp. 3C11]